MSMGRTGPTSRRRSRKRQGSGRGTARHWSVRSCRGPAVLALVLAVLAVLLLPIGTAQAAAVAPSPRPSTSTKAAPAPAKPSPKVATSVLSKPTKAQVKAGRAASARAAVQAAADQVCSGAIVLDTVYTCSSIGQNQTKTFQLTTTVASDNLLVQLTNSGDASIVGSLVGPDGTQLPCSIGAVYGPDSCVTGDAGSYTLSVTNAEFEGGFTVAVASVLSSHCTALSDTDLAPGAADRQDSLALAAASNCYGLDQSAGEVIRLSDTPYEVQGDIFDSTGTSACSAMGSSVDCTLTGTGPYRLFLHDTNAAAIQYPLRVTRISHPIGCAALRTAPYGDPTGAVASGSLAPTGIDCRTVALQPGPIDVVLAPSVAAGPFSWGLYSEAGQLVCLWNSSSCTVPEAADYSLLLTNPMSYAVPTPAPTAFQEAVLPITETDGCAATTGTGFDQATLQNTMVSPLEIDCRPFTAQAGDRVQVAATQADGTLTDSWISDGTRASICPSSGSPQGCVLPAGGPYRVITRADGHTGDYSMQIYRLSAPTGCSTAALQEYGAAPATLSDRCVLLTVPAAGDYRIQAYGGSGNLPGLVYKADGTTACDDQNGDCALTAAGTYTFVANGAQWVQDTPYQLYVISPTETGGCTPGTDSGFADGPMTGSFTALGESACLQLPTAAGTGLDYINPVQAGFVNPVAKIVDSTGAVQCGGDWFALTTCALAGTAPYRLVLTAASVGSYSITANRTDSAAGCTAFAQSGFDSTPGAWVTLTPQKPAACLSIPAGAHSASEMVDFASSQNVANADLRIADASGVQVCATARGYNSMTNCALDPTRSYQALLYGGNFTDSYQLVRRDLTSGADCAAAPTTVGAPVTTYTLSGDLDSTCTRLTGAATDSYLVHSWAASKKFVVIYTDAQGKTVYCANLLAGCLLSGSTSYQVITLAQNYAGTPVPVQQETWRLESGGAFANECQAQTFSMSGFAPIHGTLGLSQSGVCGVVPTTPGSTLDIYYPTGPGAGVPPIVSLITPDRQNHCVSYSTYYECSVPSSAAATSALLLVSPAYQAGLPLDYALQGVCGGTCHPPASVIQTVSPAAGQVGTAVQVTVAGTGLNLGDELQLTRSGQTTITGAVRDAAADGTSVTASFDLAGAASGPWDVTLVPPSGARTPVTLPGAFTVSTTPVRKAGSSLYVPVAPARVLDTRNGTGGFSKPLGAGGVLALPVVGRSGVPASGVSAVVLNVTATGATSDDWVSVYPDGQARPGVSNLNFGKGQALANLVTVPVVDGKVDFYNANGSVNLVADLVGYYTTAATGSTFVSSGPTRVLDTRNGTGTPKQQLGAGKTISLQIAGVNGAPANVTAVAMNVTATGAGQSSWIAAYPDGQALPKTSTVNFAAGHTTPNLAIVPVVDGKVDFYNANGSVDVIADVTGYFTGDGAGAYFYPTVPTRMLDTRNGTGSAKQPVGPAAGIALQVAGQPPVPAAGVSAVVMNVTVTGATVGSWLAAYPDGQGQPTTSTLNFTKGLTVANLAIIPTSNGKVDFYNANGTVNVIADLAGYFSTS